MFDYLGDLLLQEKEMSIADQMRISKEAAAKRKPYQPGDRQKQHAALMKGSSSTPDKREQETSGRYSSKYSNSGSD